jgi:hypothetical protein
MLKRKTIRALFEVLDDELCAKGVIGEVGL